MAGEIGSPEKVDALRAQASQTNTFLIRGVAGAELSAAGPGLSASEPPLATIPLINAIAARLRVRDAFALAEKEGIEQAAL